MAQERSEAGEAVQSEAPEPIAIVGIGCRFPGGAHGPDGFWRLLTGGTDAVSEVPSDRWSTSAIYDPDPKNRGRSNSKWGGFIDQIDRFDAAFFKISPREAALMDPQQRLLLEVSFEALDDGGLDADALAGSATGVFIGICSHDYSDIQTKDLYATDVYTATGSAMSIAANRISYCFDFQGPSFVVDTACSSSLVAMHLACQSLQRRECSAALSGGVNLMITPEVTLGFSRAMMLSPTGRCHAFDASADGYVRGEGAGVVVLKRLADAQAAGDRIYAVIIGDGVNQDGHSQGMTVPNEKAQERLLRDIYGRAHVDPNRILYFEAHGTGTPVGDPLEAAAIGEALGRRRRPDNPLRIGSVKTNIGHLEASAGMAGVIKSALILHHRVIPPSLHFTTPNPRIALADLNLRVQQTLEPLADDEAATVIGVNSFGFGGTNAHVALDIAPAAAATPSSAARSSYLIPVSARAQEALVESAARLLAQVGDGDTSLRDLAFSLGARATHHDQRLAMPVTSVHDLQSHLAAFVTHEPRQGSVTGRRAANRPVTAFVFSGMGPQWWGMGRQLLAEEPVFNSAVERCDHIFRGLAGWSIVEQMGLDAEHSRMDRAEVAQPANFVLQVGLTELWRSWGVQPDRIVGHSAGEVAASWAAGILDIEDAVAVIYHRSRLQQRTTDLGRMLAAGLPAARAAALSKGFSGRVSVAAFNSPRSVTFTGDADVLQELATVLTGMQVFNRMLDGRVPYHSHHMDPLRDELMESLAGIVPHPAQVPFYSVVSGDRADGREVDGLYWWRNVREPVNFQLAVETMIGDGVDAWIEVAPHPVMGRSVVETYAEQQTAAVPVVASLRREAPERVTMLSAAATMYTLGARLDWRQVNGDGLQVRRPAYPWQRERCWSEPERSAAVRLPTSHHPLLEQRAISAVPTWQTHLAGSRLAYIREHVVQDAVVFPAAAYLDAVLAANRELTGSDAAVIEDVRFRRAMVIAADDDAIVQLTVQPQDYHFSIHSRMQAGQSWALNVTGRLNRTPAPVTVSSSNSLAEVQRRCQHRVPLDRVHDSLLAMGLRYGPAFRGLETVWMGHQEALGLVRRPQSVRGDGNGGHIFHPAFMDACFQVVPFATLLMGVGAALDETILPTEMGRLRFSGAPPGDVIWCHTWLITETRTAVVGGYAFFDEDGRILATIDGVKGQRVPNTRASGSLALSGMLHATEWFARGLRGPAAPAAYMPSPAALCATLAASSRESRRSEHRAQIEPLVDSFVAALTWRTLGAAGRTAQPGAVITLDCVATDTGTIPARRGFLARLLELAGQVGILRSAPEGWIVSDTADSLDPVALGATLSEQAPDAESIRTAAERAAETLPDVLRGAQAHDQALAPDDVLFRLFDESPFGAFYNDAAQAAVRAVTAALPPGRAIRVLEVGAGTGSTTLRALSVLPRHRTEYVATDIAAPALASVRSRIGDYPFVEVRELDLDGDLAAQGCTDRSVDLVIAADVLHLSANLPASLSRLGQLLAPGGMLIAIVPTRPTSAFDLLYGPQRDWHALDAADPRRNGYWLAAEDWRTLLGQCGFGEVGVASDRTADGPGTAAVLIGRIDASTAPVTTPAPVDETGTWVVLLDETGVGTGLCSTLEARGDTVIRVQAGAEFLPIGEHEFQVRPESAAELVMLARSLADVLPTCRGLVHCWALDDVGSVAGHAHDGRDDSHRSDDSPFAGHRGALSVLHLVQALDQAEVVAPPRLWIVTRGGQWVDGDRTPVRPDAAMLWGLGRVSMNEQPQLRTTLLDLDPASPSPADVLASELLADDVEQEVAWRGSVRLLPRLVRARLETLSAAAGFDPASASFQLEVAKPGALESMRLREVARCAPGAGEVEVDVRFAGINFRDVMKAMGMFQEHLGDAFMFGDESAGVIVRVGDGVSGFSAGDEVICVHEGSFGRHITVAVENVHHKPAHLSLEEAAALPMVFLTVHYALNHVARLQAGEKILIHSAAGGVGLAAIQMARRAGAEIFATAGSREKRALLRSMGIAHVMDSRTLDFADQIMAVTGGRGLDVVLNSLAGEFLTRSLSLLRPTGRFVELGKVDFFENSRIGLAPFKRGLSFLGVDLSYLRVAEPDLCRRVFREVMEMFESRELQPLPVRIFPASEAAAAFRFIMQARHIGKVVIDMHDSAAISTRVATPAALFRADATYLVTGGTRGFGLAVAEWMIGEGARSIVLTGRPGSPEPADEVLARMRETGASVTIMRADVGRGDAVAALIADIERTQLPLKGVIHAAAVYDDGFMLQLDDERFDAVVRAKASAAWHLHRQTQHLDLDAFVLFSSVSSIIGSPGQANYAAANAALDALAHYRRAAGLPALTVNWTAISETGYLSRHVEVARELDRQGLSAIAPSEACTILGILLRGATPHVAVAKLENGQIALTRSSDAVRRRFSLLDRGPSSERAVHPSNAKALLILLAQQPLDARPPMIETALRQDLSRLLGVRATAIDAERPLAELGIDSLMSVELEIAVREALGVELPLGFLVGEKATLRHLSQRLAHQSQAAIDLINAGQGGAFEPVERTAVA